jgi:HK97 gp10 family phage protein
VSEGEEVIMASDRVKIDGMAAAIMKGLEEYAEVATSDLKASVRKAGSNVRKDIQANAPKKTGAYSKSWSVKTTKETSNTLELTVYSPKKYQLAHLLEYGHAKRGGGRTKAQPHIAPAEEAAISQLERDIKRSLGG